MAILLTVNGNATGNDLLFASVGDRRFPARVSLTNTGSVPVQAELRMRPGSGARVTIADPNVAIGPGSTVETTIQAETPSAARGDTVLEVVVAGGVEAEFKFTAISLLRESVFHNLVPPLPERK